MPLVERVDCIQIPVPDLEAGLAFYRDRLGHALVWRTPTAAGLRLPGCAAELVVQTERPEMEPNLLVASADDAARAVAAAGGSVLIAPFDIAIGRCAVVADPWGNRLVLLDAHNGRLTTGAGGHVVGVAPGPAAGPSAHHPGQERGAAPPGLERAADRAAQEQVPPSGGDASGSASGRAATSQAPARGAGASILLRDSAQGITPDQLHGFFAGWHRPVSAAEHLRVLSGSTAVVIAVDDAARRRVVGFVTALSDGVLSAHITLVEVLPEYRGRGIGRAMVGRLLARLGGLYAVDAVCDPGLLPFYAACGLAPAAAAIRRRY